MMAAGAGLERMIRALDEVFPPDLWDDIVRAANRAEVRILPFPPNGLLRKPRRPCP